MKQASEIFDLIIIGGGFAGSTLALQALKRDPNHRILLLEKQAEFGQKVGESTVDMAALLMREFGYEDLLKPHQSKSGIRFVFNGHEGSDPAMYEEFASPVYPGIINGHHLDRKSLDQALFERAIQAGVRTIRPVNVTQIQSAAYQNTVTYQFDRSDYTAHSKWLVDATGRARFVPRQLGWKDKNLALSTSAVMAHFDHLAPSKDWDRPVDEHWENQAIASRDFSTTHLMRPGGWWWVIRLNNERTSVGFVYDQKLVHTAEPDEFFEHVQNTDPQIGAMLNRAKMVNSKKIEGLAYCSEKLYQPGVALLGESGAFVDPLISPGIEMIGQQVLWLADLLTKHPENDGRWQRYEKRMQRAYQDRLRIYKNVYAFMTHRDIMEAWLMLGNVFYFGSVVYPAVLLKSRLKYPLFIPKLAYWGLDFFEGRLLKMAAKRTGTLRQKQPVTYSRIKVQRNGSFLYTIPRLIVKAAVGYLRLELRHILK